MSDHHIQSIRRRRAQVQRQIESEQAPVNPEWTRIAHLKRQRLRLKDQLERALADASRSADGPRQTPVAELRRWVRNNHSNPHS
jgi:hypothetical protein